MIRIVEVGPRDGLQNETAAIPTDVKIAFVDALSGTGVSEIEVSAFVSPRMVPQLSDAKEVLRRIRRRDGVVYSTLVPNIRGLDRALEAGVDKIAVFTAASETFNQKNINASVADSLRRFDPVVKQAGEMNLPVRGYISTAFWCAFEGRIAPRAVVDLAKELINMGICEVAVSDTIGKATPEDVARLFDLLLPEVPAGQIAVHFHDTFGRGVANALESLACGIETVDASAGGLGGCPFAPGATGNVATEDVVRALVERGEAVTVDIDGLIRAGKILAPYLADERRILPEPVSQACAVCEFFNGRSCCGRKSGYKSE